MKKAKKKKKSRNKWTHLLNRLKCVTISEINCRTTTTYYTHYYLGCKRQFFCNQFSSTYEKKREMKWVLHLLQFLG